MGFSDLLAAADRAVRSLLQSDGAIVYTPGTGSPAETVRGIFDAVYRKIDILGQSPGVSSSGPAVFLTLADLPSDPETDADATVTVAGVVYTPHTVEKDGEGGVILMLHRA